MDFSKIKKIFYIVAIISMILSIKSRVFGAFGFYTINNSTETLDLSSIEDYYYYVGACYYTSERSYTYQVVVSDKPFIIYRNSNPTNTNGGSFYSLEQCSIYTAFGSGSLTQLRNIISNASPTVSTSANYGFTTYNPSRANGNLTIPANSAVIACNFDIKDQNGDIFFHNSDIVDPFFSNPEELQDAPENVFIELGDYSANEYLYFHLLEVTNIMPMSNNDSTYYYNDHTFALNKDSKYYTQLFDTTKYYYSIPRSALGLNPNTSYFYVLTNSSTQIANSINPITEGDGVYDVIMQDTTGIITEDMAANDKLQNINQEFNDYQQQQQEFQNQNSLTPETETDISNNLSFNNSTPQFSNLFNSYFSRLTSLVSDLGNYNDYSVITLDLPIPHSSTTIPLRSDMLSSNIPTDIYTIIQMFWLFIFGSYYIKFLIRIYRLASTGLLLDYYSLSGEIITHDML